eukprot:scaffold2708_cov100-Isochrysis_galbana.AAC.4
MEPVESASHARAPVHTVLLSITVAQRRLCRRPNRLRRRATTAAPATAVAVAARRGGLGRAYLAHRGRALPGHHGWQWPSSLS